MDFLNASEAIQYLANYTRKTIKIASSNQLVSIFDIVDEETLNDPQEQIYDLIDPEEEKNYKYEVKTMNSEQAKNHFKTMNGDTTVYQAYLDYAEDEQKELVDFKKKRFDSGRIIITSNGKIVDGNHHFIAAIDLKKTIKYIDLQKPIV